MRTVTTTTMDNQPQTPPLRGQSTETYFFFPSWLVGALHVCKRVVEGLALVSVGGHEWQDALWFIIARLAIAAITDYSVVKTPTVTTTVTTPNPAKD